MGFGSSCVLYPNVYIHVRETQAALLGRFLEEGLQGLSRTGPEGHGCRAVRRPVGMRSRFGQALEGLGSGVYELVEDHRGDTFRAVYAVRVGDAVHVLHAFQKKSKSGIATPRPDVELIEKRLKAVLARYAASGRS